MYVWEIFVDVEFSIDDCDGKYIRIGLRVFWGYFRFIERTLYCMFIIIVIVMIECVSKFINYDIKNYEGIEG